MSTSSLVILAIFTALTAVGALFFLRWREQKRLERARKAVIHSDQMGELNLIGESLQPWVSPAILHFIALDIQQHGNELSLLQAPDNKRCNKALENALIWLNATPKPPAKLPTQVKQAQEIRNLIQRLQDIIRSGHQQQRISTDQARQFLHETRLLNVKIAVTVFDAKATAAASINNPSQAVQFLKKAEAALNQLTDPPDDLKAMLEAIQQRINEQQELRQPAAGATRLEEGAEWLSAEDDSWKKKHF